MNGIEISKEELIRDYMYQYAFKESYEDIIEILKSHGLTQFDSEDLSKDNLEKAIEYMAETHKLLNVALNENPDPIRYFCPVIRGDYKTESKKAFRAKEFYFNEPNALAHNDAIKNKYTDDDFYYKPDIDNHQKLNDPKSFRSKTKDGKVLKDKIEVKGIKRLSKEKVARALSEIVYQNKDPTDALKDSIETKVKEVELKKGSLSANTYGTHYDVKVRENNEDLNYNLINAGMLGDDEAWQDLYR